MGRPARRLGRLGGHWGQGLTTEAATAVLTWARDRLPSARIIAKAYAENARSIRVLEKVGLRFDHREEAADAPTNVYCLAQAGSDI